MTKQADAAPPPAATRGAPPRLHQGVKVIPGRERQGRPPEGGRSAAKKSEGTGDTAKVEKVVAASEKEAAAADQIKTLAESTPAAAGVGRSGGRGRARSSDGRSRRYVEKGRKAG